MELRRIVAAGAAAAASAAAAAGVNVNAVNAGAAGSTAANAMVMRSTVAVPHSLHSPQDQRATGK